MMSLTVFPAPPGDPSSPPPGIGPFPEPTILWSYTEKMFIVNSNLVDNYICNGNGNNKDKAEDRENQLNEFKSILKKDGLLLASPDPEPEPEPKNEAEKKEPKPKPVMRKPETSKTEAGKVRLKRQRHSRPSTKKAATTSAKTGRTNRSRPAPKLTKKIKINQTHSGTRASKTSGRDYEGKREGLRSGDDKILSNKCIECDRTFPHTTALQLHMRTHAADVKRFECRTCGAKFSQLKAVKSHIIVNHKVLDNVCRQIIILTRSFCGAANGVGVGAPLPDSDVASHPIHDELSLPAPVVDGDVDSVSVRDSVSSHPSRPVGVKRCVPVHRIKLPVRVYDVPLPLPNRGNDSEKDSDSSHEIPPKVPTPIPEEQETVTSEPSLPQRNHAKLQLFRCRICSQFFRRQKELQLHIMDTHDLTEPYICSICKKRFPDLKSIHGHLRVFHNETSKSKCAVRITPCRVHLRRCDNLIPNRQREKTSSQPESSSIVEEIKMETGTDADAASTSTTVQPEPTEVFVVPAPPVPFLAPSSLSQSEEP